MINRGRSRSGGPAQPRHNTVSVLRTLGFSYGRNPATLRSRLLPAGPPTSCPSRPNIEHFGTVDFIIAHMYTTVHSCQSAENLIARCVRSRWGCAPILAGSKSPPDENYEFFH